MASAFQPSEGFYAALQFHPNLNTAASNFLELHEWCLKMFSDNSKVVGTNKAGFMSSMMTADKSAKDRKTILGSLSAAVSAVMTTRSATPYNTMPDKAYMTGGEWPSEVQKFKLEHFGMKDYNSSDVILEYKKGKYSRKPHYVGISLKEKEREAAANPPLINNAFSNYIDDNPELVTKIDDHRKKFFASVIIEACQEGGPLFGLTMPGNGSGKKGKLISQMNLNDMTDVEDIWAAKVAVVKNNKQLMLPLINLKQPVDMVNRSGIVENSETDGVKYVFRKYVNQKLQSTSSTINPLFQGFLDIMSEDSVKEVLANALLSRVLKLDLYNELDVWTKNEFAFYLVVGVGNYGATGHSIGQAQIESLESLLVAISTLADQPTNLVFDKSSTNKANAAKVFFTLFKGNTGVLDVELRYGGNFKAMPRFHANMHPDFVKIIKTNVHVLDPL